MPNKRIDQLNPNFDALTGNELIPIFDTSSNTTERISLNTLANFVDSTTDTFVTGATYNNNDNVLTLGTNNNGFIDVTIDRYNKQHIPSGQTLTIPSNFQSFSYGDLIVDGTLMLEENSQLVVLNGDIILSGGTISGTGTTYIVDLPEFNTFVTSGNFNPSTKQITFTGNFGFTPFNVDLSPLKFTGNTISECIPDIYVTNVNSCSPLHIQPVNNGDVYISESGGYVGVGTTNPQVTLDVNGDVNISNSLSATTYYGDASNLTNINNFITTAITLSSPQILSLGTPIQVLPPPGLDKYYIIDRIQLEYSYGTVGYEFPTSPTFYLDGCFDSYIIKSLLTDIQDTVCVINSNLRNTITVGSGSGSVQIITNKDVLNTGLVIGTTNGDNPINGDGTLRIKVTYKIETFGS